MKFLLSTSLLTSLSFAGAAVPANKICITNSGGYVLHWWMLDLITGTSSADSGNYPIDQTVCMGFSSIYGLSEGDLIFAQVHAVAGVTNNVDTAVYYQATPAMTVTYTCGGTTTMFNCRLVGEMTTIEENFL